MRLDEWVIKVMMRTFVGGYRLIAPKRIRRSCRFNPTCSEYMLLAMDKHGSYAGILLGLRRLGRCKPPNSGLDFP
jgi:putative component of membrane protein insertase Oxa1/YidC/SpoIIIJ protein YidD